MAEETIDPSLLEQTKNQIRKLVAEIAELAEADVQPPEFYGEFLTRVVQAVAASGGALWLLDGKGSLKLQNQVEFRLSGLLDGRARTQPHDTLLGCMLQANSAQIIPPGAAIEGVQGAGNPTPYSLIIAPLTVERQIVGLVEVLMDPNRRAATQKSTLRFVSDLCDLATKYLKNRQMRQIMSQQQMWNQLEGFTQSVHNSLNLKETSYAVVNDGKRLVNCDRLSVALKIKGRVAVEAISGQEVVEQRANLIRELNRLCKSVISSGEDLVYTGDTEAFGPEIRDALEIYVDESGSKGMAIVLLHKPEPDATKEKVVYGCLIAEQIGDEMASSDLQARTEVVARHSSAAVWNAMEYDKIFLRPVLKTIGSQLKVFRGRTWAKVIAVVGLIIATILIMALVQWKLVVKGDGSLNPERRRILYAPTSGIVNEVLVEHGQVVEKDQVMMRLVNLELDKQYKKLQADLEDARSRLLQKEKALTSNDTPRQERPRISAERSEALIQRDSAIEQIKIIKEQLDQLEIKAPFRGLVTTWEIRKNFLNRPVEIGQDLITVADLDGPIVLEVQVPDDDMAPVLAARESHVKRMTKDLEDLQKILDSGASGPDREAARLKHDILERGVKLLKAGLIDEEINQARQEIADAEERLKKAGHTVPEHAIPAYFVTATDPSKRYPGVVVRIASKAELVEQNHVVKVTVGFNSDVRNEFLARNQNQGFRPGAGVRAGLDCGQARLAYCLFRDVVHVWYETVLFRWPFL